MKIVNIENGNRVVYIQYRDIKKILDINSLNVDWEIDVDLSIIEETDYPYEFIRITDDKLVDFLSNLDYVVDFNYVQFLTKDEFAELKESIYKEYKKAFNKYTKVRIDKESPERIRSAKVRLEELDHKYLSLTEIELAKEGLIDMHLPHDVLNGTKEAFDIMVDSPYIVNYGLSKNSLVIKRKDNGKLDYDDMDLDLLMDISTEAIGNYFYYFEYVTETHENYVYITFHIMHNSKIIEEENKRALKFI